MLMSQNITVSVAETDEEIEAAQHLRYQVFYDECKAQGSALSEISRLDVDCFDKAADHLIVKDHAQNDPRKQVVGTYRLITRDKAMRAGGFYSAHEYDLSPLLSSNKKILELGRSCVLQPYRQGSVLRMLWQWICVYMMAEDIDLMFGCASFDGLQLEKHAAALAYLYDNHLAPADLRPRAIDHLYIPMEGKLQSGTPSADIRRALPPLLRGYLNLGAEIGDGAVMDTQFNTIDVCIVLQMKNIGTRYKNYLGRHAATGPLQQHA